MRPSRRARRGSRRPSWVCSLPSLDTGTRRSPDASLAEATFEPSEGMGQVPGSVHAGRRRRAGEDLGYRSAMPRRTKKSTPKQMTKTAFVLGLGNTPAEDIVRKAKAEGVTLTKAHVYTIRAHAKPKRKR